MNELKNKNEITSLELMEQINIFRKQEKNKTELRHDTLLNIIRDEFEEEIGVQKILETLYEHPQNKQKYPMFILNLNQAKQVLVRESKFVRKAVIEYIEKLEEQLQNPFKNLSMQQMMILTLQEQEKIVERVDIIEHKIDNEIRVDNGEQRKIQKAVSTRIFQRIDIVPQLLENKKIMFQALYRDLKDRFGVASYRDIKRKDLRNCLEYISTWIEPADFRTAS